MGRVFLTFGREAIVTIGCLAIFVVYYPVAVWVHRSYVQVRQPKGELVELIHGFEVNNAGRLQARVFSSAVYLKGTLYEDLTPLQEVVILGLPWRPPAWRFIEMPTLKDGSDPRTNGRRYYLVHP